MNAIHREELRQLDMADDAESVQRYNAICNRRDQILTHAIVELAQYLQQQTGYQVDEALDEAQNNQNAAEMVQDYLSERSSIPEMEQRLLALVGRGVLFNKNVPQDMVGEVRLIGPTEEQLDPLLVHRVARALDRSPEQELMLWQNVDVQLGEADDPLVRTAIRILLDEVPVSTLDESMEKMILDSIPGG